MQEKINELKKKRKNRVHKQRKNRISTFKRKINGKRKNFTIIR